MEYELTVDGYVTLPSNVNSINSPMNKLRELLTAQAGELIYQGRGHDIAVNTAAGDVAWGPIPDLLDFQPLGAGKSAKIRWTVKVTITEPPFRQLTYNGENRLTPFLQFNYETSVIYGEDGYSSLSCRGIIEIPMTRTPTQKSRTLSVTVDHFRGEIERRIMSGIDLSRFRMTRREFSVSRDKRTLEWDLLAEEIPYMKLPPGCTVARGNYNVRPVQAGMGLARWYCTLRATYTVRGQTFDNGDANRRVAWLSFLALLRMRMKLSEGEEIPLEGGGDPKNKKPIKWTHFVGPTSFLNIIPNLIDIFSKTPPKNKDESKQRAFLRDFSFDEGLYLDSKTTSFSATWLLVVPFSHIMLASGIWTKLPEKNVAGDDLWAISMKDVQGATSWLPNILDPKLDIIVDFGERK